jgi:hypothetical protein
MGIYGDDLESTNSPGGSPPVAMFGHRNGQAWVADDIFVTRCRGGDLLVERWDERGLRTATVRKDSPRFFRDMWEKLNEVAIDGALEPPS